MWTYGDLTTPICEFQQMKFQYQLADILTKFLRGPRIQFGNPAFLTSIFTSYQEKKINILSEYLQHKIFQIVNNSPQQILIMLL